MIKELIKVTIDRNKKIRCGKCDRIIAEGELPAKIIIECKCGASNTLNVLRSNHK